MKQKLKKTSLTLPNLMTLSRLACVPVVLLCLCFPGKTGSFLAALFFSIAALTDILDGFLARRHGDVTVLGKFLDPLVDKILISVTMIMLIPLARVPAWIVIIIIAREMALTGLRGIAASDGIVIQASRLGKYKTVLQSAAIAALCLHYTYAGINFHLIGTIVLYGALIMTVWSGWDYFQKFYRVLVPA